MPPHTVTNNQPVGQIVNATALDFFFFFYRRQSRCHEVSTLLEQFRF